MTLDEIILGEQEIVKELETELKRSFLSEYDEAIRYEEIRLCLSAIRFHRKYIDWMTELKSYRKTWSEIIKRIHYKIGLISKIDDDSNYQLGLSCGLMMAEQIINDEIAEVENEHDNRAD